MTPPDYRTSTLNHLGILAGVIRQIGLIETIDAALPPAPDQKVTTGEATAAMILNGLGFVGRALYLTPEFFRAKPVKLLLRDDLEPEDLNDDTLGRALDRLFSFGVTELFTRASQEALRRLGVSFRFVHLDSSSFSLTGEYDRDLSEGEILITQGYSKDNRPDLKQVIVNLIVSEGSSIPLHFEALSGNTADKTSFRETIASFVEQWKGQTSLPIFVVDSALYSKDNLARLSRSNVKWITRVPETLQTVRDEIQKDAPGALHPDLPGYRLREVETTYAGLPQRWLVVHSEAARKREEKTFARRLEKAREEAEQALGVLLRRSFSCETDAREAALTLSRPWPLHRLSGLTFPTEVHHAKRGRPKTWALPDQTVIRLSATLEEKADEIVPRIKRLGVFVLATNETPEALSAADMLSMYKKQGTSVERGFRFLKDPLFFAENLFLKTPSRIMALTMIMSLALLVYALAEKLLRDALKKTKTFLPNQLGKLTQSLTIRRAFQLFNDVHLLEIMDPGGGVTKKLMNFQELHRTILSLLGPAVEKCYFLA